MSKLAILGGKKAVQGKVGDMFKWPIVTKETEKKVLEVLRDGRMSDIDVTKKFEEGFAKWHGVKYALGHNNGTAALHGAMFGLGIGKGDEIICPSVTYWASCLPVFSLGGTVVFADIHPETLCIDPNDIERHITERTKAILVVHYCAVPADMDAIMKIARKHNLKVIEDCSHSQGALYKRKITGTFGDVSAYSLMSGKSFAIGEAGIMLTNDQRIYERAVLFGHYERHAGLQLEDLKSGADIPWGGYKYRMHQLSSAVGVVQLKNYPKQIKEIDKAMKYFNELLKGVPGIKLHLAKESNSTKGGWYAPVAFYNSNELGGLSVSRFTEAVRAEGINDVWAGCNRPLHTHPLFNEIDVYNDGKPTRIANSPVDIRQPIGSLPVSEKINEQVLTIPWFKHYKPQIIKEYAMAFRKAAENYKELLPGDKGNPVGLGGWSHKKHKK
ncbi:MAG: DegT/DnrJ/EryC1/StrS family aminotransferase [Elusimicrobia bacterium]|nr:DegT/DnrJ/EryC1/StrS family aminotransferase [Elusimicrobiota bacterium]